MLAGLALRISLLGLDVRLHPDEALFAAQARLVSHQGDLLLRTTDLDKPPLTFYTAALSFAALGPREFAARLPNVLASGLSIALLYALALRLSGSGDTAALTALLAALSPFDLAFAATAFTDVQVTLWVLAACLLAVRDRWRAAGIAAALGFAAKTSALMFVPLVAALGTAALAHQDWTARDVLRRWWAFLWPLAAGIALVVLWDLGRAPRSFLSLGYARFDPGRVIRSDEVGPRLDAWAHWLGFVTGSRALNLALLAGVLPWLGRGALRRARAALHDWLIAGFALAFLAWHWLVAFNTYDRYLHTLVPFLLLLAGRMLAGVGRRRTIVAALAVAAMLPGALQVMRGDAPIGGDRGQHTGIDRLAAALNTDQAGQTVYDHWLGWELAFYLGEAPRVALVYTPLPETLAADMAPQTGPRYFVAPSPAHAAPWLDALHAAGISTAIVYHDPQHGFVVYALHGVSSAG